MALAECKNYDEAFNQFDKSIDINPNLTSSYFYKANLCKKLGFFDKAIKLYDAVLEKNPKDFTVIIVFCFCLIFFLNNLFYFQRLKIIKV